MANKKKSVSKQDQDLTSPVSPGGAISQTEERHVSASQKASQMTNGSVGSAAGGTAGSESEGITKGMSGENFAAVPGSDEGGTLSGTPGLLAGGHFGTEPETPHHIPPYGPMPQAIPMGTDEAILGTSIGDISEGIVEESKKGEKGQDVLGGGVQDSAGVNELGSTLGGRPSAGATAYQRALEPNDLYSTHKRVRDEEGYPENEENW